MKMQRPRGTYDRTPEAAPLWRHLRQLFDGITTQFGYADVDPPVFEHTDLFTRAVGEDTDVVSKEMYTFADRKGRSLSLRPEGTAGVVRLLLENRLLAAGGMRRLAYWGPMFRYDRPQAGRFRQFFQLGVESFGSASAAADVEVIELFVAVLREVGLAELRVSLGSVGDDCCRPDYMEVLSQFLGGVEDSLCPTCRERRISNPLRVFDCKVPGCQELLADAPSMMDHLCADCSAHRDRVETLLNERGISFERDAGMVRGLDYYTRTVFEVHYPALGAQSALGGGGRYDHLVEECGGPPTPAVGFSSGLERLILAIGNEGTLGAEELVARGAYVVLLSPEAEPAAARIAGMLRETIPVEIDLSSRSLKAQLKSANQRSARFAILLGAEELAAGTATVKDLDSGEQKALPEGNLLELIQAWSGAKESV